MKHKVLFISSWYPNKLEPTNGNFVQRHAEAAAKFNDVEALHVIGDKSLGRRIQTEEEFKNGIRTLTVYYKKSDLSLINFIRRFLAYSEGIRQVNKPDLIHANIAQNQMLFALYLKIRFKIPFVISEHWSGLLPENFPKLSLVKKRIARLIYQQSSYFLPVSKRLKESMEHNLRLKIKTEVVGNVVDTDIFKPQIRNGDAFTFLHISSLDSNKNPLKILQAFHTLTQKYSHINLQIGGDGDVESLLAFVEENNALRIEIFGIQKPEEVASRMAAANCFILFSNYENLPCVLIESLACGTPVIATNVGGISEFVNERNGILIPGNDTLALQKAMEQMLMNEKIFSAEKMRTDIEKEFSVMQIGRRFTQIYDDVLNEKSI